MSSDKKNINLRWGKESMFLFFSSISKFKLISCLCIDLLLFAFSLTFLSLLFKISVDSSLGNSLNYIYLLGLVVVGSYIVSSIRLRCDLSLRKDLIHVVKDKFSKAMWNTNDTSVLARLISRDLSVLLDIISNTLKFLYFPIAIAVMLTIAYWLEGISGLVALSLTSLFLVLSFYIAKKSIVLANKIYAISKLRIDKASWFVRYRPYLKNWNVLGVLDEINNITKTEIKLRNRDSFIRSFDLYTILFGSVIPVLFLLLFALIVGRSVNHFLLIVLWFSGPMISLVMEMGRFSSDYTTAKNAFKEIHCNLKNELPNYNGGDVLLNNDWEIWEGTLSDNLLQHVNPMQLSLADALGLHTEFNHRVSNIEELKLDFMGKNVSEGQKTRILLIRAIHLAILLKRPLFINISLNSLDPLSCKKFYDLLPKLKSFCEIKLTSEQEFFFQEQIARSISFEIENYREETHFTIDNQAIEQIGAAKSDNFMFNLFNLVSPIGLFFIIPAIFLSLNAYIISSSLSGLSQLGLLSLITALALILAPSLGYIIESINRKKAITLQDKLLRHSILVNINDLLQRISKDFTVMVERISWYIHDIFWYLSLILVALSAVTYTSGSIGIVVNMVFIGIILILCNLFASTIKNARLGAVEGINASINSLQNIASLGQRHYSVFEEKKNHWCELGFNTLLETHLKMISSKVAFSNIISASTGLFIIIVVLISSINHLHKSELVFLLTSLLAIASTIVNLFQALTGFNAQLQSYIRLRDIPVSEDLVSTGEIKKENQHYIVTEFIHRTLGIRYKQVILEEGKVYSLSGHSGLGKTEFLKTIANFNDSVIQNITVQSQPVKTMYMNHETINLLKNLYLDNIVTFLISKIEKESFNLIILDEVFRHASLKDTHEVLEKLKEIISINKSILIIVDHRFEFAENRLVMKNIF